MRPMLGDTIALGHHIRAGNLLGFARFGVFPLLLRGCFSVLGNVMEDIPSFDENLNLKSRKVIGPWLY